MGSFLSRLPTAAPPPGTFTKAKYACMSAIGAAYFAVLFYDVQKGNWVIPPEALALACWGFTRPQSSAFKKKKLLPSP